MKAKNVFTLIDGEFSTADGKELLTNLYSDKIQFHQMKNFSSNERFGRDDETAIKRIPELRECIKNISSVVKEAESKKKNLIIKSVINISFSKSEK